MSVRPNNYVNTQKYYVLMKGFMNMACSLRGVNTNLKDGVFETDYILLCTSLRKLTLHKS